VVAAGIKGPAKTRRRNAGSSAARERAPAVCDPKAPGQCEPKPENQLKSNFVGCNAQGTGQATTTCGDTCAPTGNSQNIAACCGEKNEPCCFDADCVVGLACDRKVLGSSGDSHKCVAGIPLGSACTAGGKPCDGNGFCVDGVCCNRGVRSSCPNGGLCNSNGDCP
jgi:hypothetical protein